MAVNVPVARETGQIQRGLAPRPAAWFFGAMPSRRVLLTAIAVALAGCSGDPEGPLPGVPAGPPQSSEILLQAVDAGTGGALTDGQLRVRYLVREPITVDATGDEVVASAEPYHIAHDVTTDELVVEVRLEAPSYFRLDTVLSVARGATAGPLTVRLARRLERSAATGRPVGGTRPAAGGGTPAGGAPRPAAPSDPDAGVDRSALEAGNQAFGRGEWLAAVQAYRDMAAPSGTGAYAGAYQQGLVNQGVSHMNLGEMGAAMDALEAATDVALPSHQAWRFLAHVQCEVGRVDEGLDSLDELEDLEGEIPATERREALAFGKFEEGLCRKRTFDRTEGTLNLVNAGRSVVSAFEDFLEQADGVSSPSAELTAAVGEANSLLEEIRARMRRGG